MRGTVVARPKSTWEAIKQWLEHAYGDFIFSYPWNQSNQLMGAWCTVVATRKFKLPSEEAVLESLEWLEQTASNFNRASQQFISQLLDVQHPNITAGVLLSVTFWPLPWVAFRAILSLIGFGSEGVRRGKYHNQHCEFYS